MVMVKMDNNDRGGSYTPYSEIMNEHEEGSYGNKKQFALSTKKMT